MRWLSLVDLALVRVLEAALALEASLFETSLETTLLADLAVLSWFAESGRVELVISQSTD